MRDRAGSNNRTLTGPVELLPSVLLYPLLALTAPSSSLQHALHECRGLVPPGARSKTASGAAGAAGKESLPAEANAELPAATAAHDEAERGCARRAGGAAPSVGTVGAWVEEAAVVAAAPNELVCDLGEVPGNCEEPDDSPTGSTPAAAGAVLPAATAAHDEAERGCARRAGGAAPSVGTVGAWVEEAAVVAAAPNELVCGLGEVPGNCEEPDDSPTGSTPAAAGAVLPAATAAHDEVERGCARRAGGAAPSVGTVGAWVEEAAVV
ncbi:hypothetical protein EMWEY_00034670, partial [Eimeria maxima]